MTLPMCSQKSTQRYIGRCANPPGRKLPETLVIGIRKFQANPGGRTVPLKCPHNSQCLQLFPGKAQIWAHDNNSDKCSVRSWLRQVVGVMMALVRLAIWLMARQQERVPAPGNCMKSGQCCRAECFSHRDGGTHRWSSPSKGKTNYVTRGLGEFCSRFEKAHRFLFHPVVVS